MSTAQRVAALAIPAAVLGVAFYLFSAPDRPGQDDSKVGKAVAAAPQDAEDLRHFRKSMAVLAEAEREMPRDRWDPAYVVARVGKDPERLAEWVRTQTSLIPYRGSLRGPAGVLMDRQGNSLDRSLLLATLLENAGHATRLVRGELTWKQAAELLPQLMLADDLVTDPAMSDPPADQRAASAKSHGLDAVAIERTMKMQSDAVAATVRELNSRVADQAVRLLQALPSPPADGEPPDGLEEAVGALQEHWWVQRRAGPDWIDVDPAATASVPGQARPPITEYLSASEVSGKFGHRLDIRLVLERWEHGKLAESRILEQALDPATLTGRTLVLQVRPNAWPQVVNADPDAPFGLKSLAREQSEWTAALTAEGDTLAEAVFRARGERGARPAGFAGGLGAAIGAIGESPAAGQNGPGADGEITAAWIEYGIRVPGEPSRVHRRAVFDLIGPAARATGPPKALVLTDAQRLSRSLSLMVHAEILPVTSRIAPEYLAHAIAKSLLANESLLGTILATGAPEDTAEIEKLLDTASPPVSPLLPLAYARLAWGPFSDRVYVDRLGVVTRHRHPGIGPEGLGVRGAIDIVAGEIGVAPLDPDRFRIRVTQGVVDANLEALWSAGNVPLNAGEALKASRNWVVLEPEARDRATDLRLPEDSRFQIRQILDGRQLVVAPGEPVLLGGESFAGWWTIDGRTGTTKGTSGTVRGQCSAENSVTWRAVAIHAAKEFAWETVLCHGMTQAFNQFQESVADIQRAGYFFWWAPQAVGGDDPLKVAKDNAVVCLVGAITRGMLSTTALLPFLVSGAAESEAMIVAAQARSAMIPRPPELLGMHVQVGLSEQAALAQYDRIVAELQTLQSQSMKATSELLQWNAAQYELYGGWSPDHPERVLLKAKSDKAARLVNEAFQMRKLADAEFTAAANRKKLVRGPNLYQVAAGSAGAVNPFAVSVN